MMAMKAVFFRCNHAFTYDGARNLREEAKRFLEEANRREEDITRIEGQLPIRKMVEVMVPNNTGELVARRERVTDTEATAAARDRIGDLRDEIGDLREEVDELRSAAKLFDEEAYYHDRSIRRVNELYDEMFYLAQATDARYADRMNQIWQEILAYKDKILQLRDSMGMETPGGSNVGALFNNPETFMIPWRELRSILARPANDITPAQYQLLANMFIGIADDLGATQRFINYLADITHETEAISFNNSVFTFCPAKVAGIQFFVDATLTVGIISQMTIHPDVDIDLRNRTYTLMERSTLLSTLVHISNTGIIVGNNINDNRRNTPITLSTSRIEGRPAITLSFDQLPVFDPNAIFVQEPPLASSIATAAENRQVSITSVFTSDAADRALQHLTVDEFTMRYEVSMGAHLLSAAGNIATSVISSFGPDIIGIARDINKTVSLMRYVAEHLGGEAVEVSTNRQIREDIAIMGNNSQTGSFFIRFDMSAVMVVEQGENIIAHYWPTPNSYYTLRALNIFRDDNSQIDMGSFLGDPSIVFNAFSQLNMAQLDYLHTYKYGFIRADAEERERARQAEEAARIAEEQAAATAAEAAEQAAAAEEEARLEYEASLEGMRRAERERRAAAEEEETLNTGGSGSGGNDPSAGSPSSVQPKRIKPI